MIQYKFKQIKQYIARLHSNSLNVTEPYELLRVVYPHLNLSFTLILDGVLLPVNRNDTKTI